jgi:hypothetical protein
MTISDYIVIVSIITADVCYTISIYSIIYIIIIRITISYPYSSFTLILPITNPLQSLHIFLVILPPPRLLTHLLILHILNFDIFLIIIIIIIIIYIIITCMVVDHVLLGCMICVFYQRWSELYFLFVLFCGGYVLFVVLRVALWVLLFG